jgi:hypothetical protein
MLRATKPPKCKHCKRRTDAIGQVLHDECRDAWVTKWQAAQERKRKAKQQAAAKAERAETRRRKEAAKTRRDLRPVAQDAFNAWVRARDAALPCVSCGATNPPMKPGGQWDAGHFLGRGAYPELAFNEDNCHKQCKSCNAGGGKFSHKARTVNDKYREELLRRIGPDRLAALEGPHPPAKLGEDDYRQITATYRARVKAMKEAA